MEDKSQIQVLDVYKQMFDKIPGLDHKLSKAVVVFWVKRAPPLEIFGMFYEISRMFGNIS